MWVEPRIRDFQFEHFGHDAIVLHGERIRQRKPPFGLGMEPRRRADLISRLADAIVGSEFDIVASVIDKRRLPCQFGPTVNPLLATLGDGVEGTWTYLMRVSQDLRPTYIVAESRGRGQDAESGPAIRRMRNGLARWDPMNRFELVMDSKKSSSMGLQAADLIALPVGRHVLSPSQPNRAWGIIARKVLVRPRGLVDEMKPRTLTWIPKMARQAPSQIISGPRRAAVREAPSVLLDSRVRGGHSDLATSADSSPSAGSF